MREFPRRLHHAVPGWVKAGAQFHVRIRASTGQSCSLVDEELSPHLLLAAQRYHDLGHWWCDLFLLIPDHLHAIVSFPPTKSMSETLQDWKRGTARFQGVDWQDGYFDHRLRELDESRKTWLYIRRNPVVKGLCADIDDWPHWWSPGKDSEQGGAG